MLALSPDQAEAQRHHRGRSVPVIVRSPLLFGGYHHSFFPFGWGYWHPGIGFPPFPGFYVGDHFSSLRLQIPQRNAIVYVDGYAAGIVDDFDGVFQRLQLVPGHHEIVVYLQGYRTLRQNLYLSPRSTHTIKDALVPLGSGEPAEPPPSPRAMPPLPGPGAAFPPPAANAQTGTFALRVQPADASVYINGELWRGPQGQDRLLIQLAEGSHRVRVEKPGLQPFVVEIDVRGGETTSLKDRKSVV